MLLRLSVVVGSHLGGPSILRGLVCRQVREGLHNSARPTDFDESSLAVGSRTKTHARIAGIQKPDAGHYRPIKDTAGRSNHSNAEARRTPESIDPAPERLPHKEIPSLQGVHAPGRGWADVSGSTASPV